ncbi:MAG: hydantoinase/oxoprolinase family protein [Planctomycetaceae bacterium]
MGPRTMHVIGLDIGGANLKAAHADGPAATRPFPLWKRPDHLPDALAELLADFPPPDLLAVTMTGELADCFATKAEGVDAILRSIEAVAGGVPIAVWQTGGEFLTPAVAREFPRLVAAANWHALATWAGRIAPQGTALLVDIGSTTTDVIPLSEGVPVPAGLTDRERLQSGELVYSGVHRTPVYAIAGSVPFRGGVCPLAAELFATALDVYLLTGAIAEDPNDLDTANGRPATVDAAHDRLARMLCCDRSECSAEEARQVAGFLAGVQRAHAAAALKHVRSRLSSPCSHLILSGSGTFLAEAVLAHHPALNGVPVVRLNETLGTETSRAACAFAAARLALEREAICL